MRYRIVKLLDGVFDMAGAASKRAAQQKQGTASMLAAAFGVGRDQAQSVVDQVTPEFRHEIERLTLSRGGLADLLDALSGKTGRAGSGGGEALENNLASAGVRNDGNRLLEYMFGSKYRSRALAQRVARRSNLDTGVVKNMLPALAHDYFGRLGNEANASLGRITNNVSRDDKFAGQEPLAIPDGNLSNYGRRSSGPFGDLSDAIRRNGRASGGAPAGGALWSIVRNVIGSALGFQSRGIMGWIIRLIVYRWGWSILKTIFSRLFLGR